MYVQNDSATVNSAVGTAPAGTFYAGNANCVRYEHLGSWHGNTEGEYGFKGVVIYRGTGTPTVASRVFQNSYGNNPSDATKVNGTIASNGNCGGSDSCNPWMLADTSYKWTAYAAGYSGGYWILKTIARALGTFTATFPSTTKTSIDVQVDWYPNTNESTATLTLQYKKLSDVDWTPWATTSGAKTGYTVSSYTATVTGLESGTTYQFRAIVSRTVKPTEANTTWDLGSKATLPASPSATTIAASGVADTHVVMNATVDPNTIDSTVSFEYGTTSGVYTAETATQLITGDGDRTVGQSVSGLTANTVYYYRVKVTYDLGAGTVYLYGSEVTFTTGVDQGALARAEDLMQTLQFDGQYDTPKTVYFTLKTKATDGSDQYYVGTPPVKTLIKIFRNGTYLSTATNDATQPNGASTYIYALDLEATEMTGETIDIIISSGGTTFRDQHIQVRTAQRLSELDIDASNGPTNASALTAIGNGSGDGIKAVGGTSGLDINAILESNWLRVGVARTQATPDSTKIRLDAASSSTDDYYNGVVVAIIGGTGVGQSRIAIDYVGGADPDTDGNREITVDSAWLAGNTPDDNSIFALAPGPRTWEMKSPGELEDLPTETSSYGEFLRLLFQRFAFKIDQNADYQTWYKTDNTNTFASRAVEDDGNTQRLYKLAE